MRSLTAFEMTAGEGRDDQPIDRFDQVEGRDYQVESPDTVLYYQRKSSLA